MDNPPYKVYDNLVSKESQDKIENVIFSRYEGYNFPLYYSSNLTGDKNSNFKEEERGFSAEIYGGNSNERGSGHPNFPFFLHPLYEICQKLNYNIWEIYRARTFMMMKQETSISTLPHIDLDYPHMVCLYYVNDSDGDTLFYDRSKKNIIGRVTPKKGRCLIFNGYVNFHSASTPTLNDRAIINYDFNLMKPNPKKITYTPLKTYE